MVVLANDPAIPNHVLDQMLEDDTHKNVRIKTSDGMMLLAHSAVLSIASPKLENFMNDHRMREDSVGVYDIHTPCISSTLWRYVLKFLYTGKIEGKEDCVMKDIVEVCRKLDILLIKRVSLTQDDVKDTKEDEGAKDDVFIIDSDHLEAESDQIQPFVVNCEEGESIDITGDENETEVECVNDKEVVIESGKGDKNDVSDGNDLDSEVLLGLNATTDVISDDSETFDETMDKEDEKDVTIENEEEDQTVYEEEVSDYNSEDDFRESVGSPKMTVKCMNSQELCDTNETTHKPLMDLICQTCGHISKSGHDAAAHLKLKHFLDKCYVCRRCLKGFISYMGLFVHSKNYCFPATDACREDEEEELDNVDKNVSGDRNIFEAFQKDCDGLDRSVEHEEGMDEKEVDLVLKGQKRKFGATLDLDDNEEDLSEPGEQFLEYVEEVEEHENQDEETNENVDSIDINRVFSSRRETRSSSKENHGDVESLLNRHWAKMVDLKCRKCGLVSTNAENCAKHLSKEHGVVDCFICQTCGSGFKTFGQFCTHAKGCDSMKSEFVLKNYAIFKCRHCSFETTKGSFTKIYDHMEKEHFDEHGYMCKECKNGFQNRKCLQYHLAVQPCGGTLIPVDKVTLLDCKICDFLGNSGLDFAQHMQEVHDCTLPFLCRLCKKGFTRMDALLIHARWDGKCRRQYVYESRRDLEG